MTERKQQILQNAIEMIAGEGYASLTMRALARASGMKLGALQYHFPTAEELLRALVGYIGESYRLSFESLKNSFKNENDSPSLRQIVLFIFDDDVGETLMGDKLWPQLWAMQQVEPLVSDLVEDVYANYIATLEQALENAGSSAPRAEALCLVSLLEGSTIFLGSGRRWEGDAKIVRNSVLEFVDSRYGESS